jgi:hypothetical protein
VCVIVFLQSAVDSLCGRLLDFSTVPLALPALSQHSRGGEEGASVSLSPNMPGFSSEVSALSSMLSPVLRLGGGRLVSS